MYLHMHLLVLQWSIGVWSWNIKKNHTGSLHWNIHKTQFWTTPSHQHYNKNITKILCQLLNCEIWYPHYINYEYCLFLDVTPWSLVQTHRSIWEICCFHLQGEIEESKFLWNICKFLPHCMAWHPRRQYSTVLQTICILQCCKPFV